MSTSNVRVGAERSDSTIDTNADSPEMQRSAFGRWISRNAEAICITIALLMVFIAPFHRALYFPPADPDDLRFLSQVSKVSNPLKYFVGDWGEGPYAGGEYGMYRPFHPISLWIVYKLFGVSAEPNQLVNLLLHFANVLLLLMIMLRVQKDRVAATLFTGLFMISLYTVSPAIWVTNRAQLQVGLALLLLILHVVKCDENNAQLKIGYVIFLSCLGLLSKESGLIVPLFAILVSIHKSSNVALKIRRSAPYVLLVAIYFLARFLMFGSHAADYANGGYLFGVFPYERLTDLPEHLRKLSLLDNVLKKYCCDFYPRVQREGPI